MEDFSQAAMEDALQALASMAGRTEGTRTKFAPGTAQHTLQANRLHALRVASALIERALAGQDPAEGFAREALERAAAPLASLTSKSEKAQAKLAPDTWQHRMLEQNLRALRMATPLLTQALDR